MAQDFNSKKKFQDTGQSASRADDLRLYGGQRLDLRMIADKGLTTIFNKKKAEEPLHHRNGERISWRTDTFEPPEPAIVARSDFQRSRKEYRL